MTPEMLAWIDGQKPQLVNWAEDYVKGSVPYKPKGGGGGRRPPARVSGSQFRNLLNAAQGGSSLAVLVNFLRYQIGRGNQGWGDRSSGQALEKIFVEDLRRLCEEGAGQLNDETREIGRFQVEAHLAAQFIGFVIREYTYRCELEGTRP